MKFRFILLLLALFPLLSIAEPLADETKITGHIHNVNVTSVRLSLPGNPITLHTKELIVHVDIDGNFQSTLELGNETEMFVNFKFLNEDAIPIFIKKGDHIQLEFDALYFDGSVLFKGDRKVENQYTVEAKRKFKKYTENFLDFEIYQRDPYEFKNYVSQLAIEKTSFLNTYKAKNSSFDQVFDRNVTADIIYWKSYFLLRYRWQKPLRQGRQGIMDLPLTYFNFLSRLPINDPSLVDNEHYQAFITEYLSYKMEETIKFSTKYPGSTIHKVIAYSLRLRDEPKRRSTDPSPKVLEQVTQNAQVVVIGQTNFFSEYTVKGEMKRARWFNVITESGNIGWLFGGGLEIIGKVDDPERIRPAYRGAELYLTGKTKDYIVAKEIYQRMLQTPLDYSLAAEVNRFITNSEYAVYTEPIKEYEKKRKEIVAVSAPQNPSNQNPPAITVTPSSAFTAASDELKKREEELNYQEQLLLEKESSLKAKEVAIQQKEASRISDIDKISNEMAELKKKLEEAEALLKKYQNGEQVATIAKPSTEVKSTPEPKEEIVLAPIEKQPKEGSATITNDNPENPRVEVSVPVENPNNNPSELIASNNPKNSTEVIPEISNKPEPEWKIKIRIEREKIEQERKRIQAQEKARIEAEQRRLNALDKAETSHFAKEEEKAMLAEKKEIDRALAIKEEEKRKKEEAIAEMEQMQMIQDQKLKRNNSRFANWKPEDIPIFKRTTISGKITNAQAYSFVDFAYYFDLISMEMDNANKSISPDGSFDISFEFLEARQILMSYNGNTISLFLEPGDSLHLSFDTQNFAESLQFMGESSMAQENAFLQKYEANFAKYSKSRIKYNSKKKAPVEFKTYIERIRFEKQAYYEEFAKGKKVRTSFEAYFYSEINHWAGYFLMMYPFEYAYANNMEESVELPTDYYGFLFEISLENDDALSNIYFSYYLDQYYSFAEENKTSKTVKLPQSKPKSNGKVECYLKAKKLYFDLKFGDPNAIDHDGIKSFLSYCDYSELKTVIHLAYEDAVRLQPGKPAPDFSLVDYNGQNITLSSLKGKVVFLDFWSTDCPPCITAIHESQRMLKTHFTEDEKQNLVFVYINLDKKKSDWQRYISTNRTQLSEGIHLYDLGSLTDANIAKMFDVRTFPHYILINKEGVIAHKPAQSPSQQSSFLYQVKDLLNEY